jgi:predicted ATP-binding protein involved in virulence
MRIAQVEIANFRGFQNFRLNLDGRSVLVIGENAGGKTALLTAIARGLGRDVHFRRPDFHDVTRPLEITITLDGLTAPQRSVFGNHVDYVSGGEPALRTQARAVWDIHPLRPLARPLRR